jgi:Ni/Co efflux regulator RcnB
VKAPPRGYHYVRSGNDILLVGITSGVVASILGGAFH